MNSQNLLSNVFKPSYVYDTAGGYVPKLTISNVDSIVVTSATVGDLAVGDSNSNVYIGINAGNPSELYSLCNSSNMTAIGVGAAQGNKNSANSVFIGLDAGSGIGGTDVSGSVSEVAIGYGTLGGGSSNVYLGALTGSIGSGNIFIGPEISPSNVSNQLRIGRGSNVTLYSDLSTGFVGINTVEPTTGFDVSGDAYFSRKVGIQYPNPVHSLDVTGQMYATDGILIGDGVVTRPSIALVNDISTGIYAYTEGASCNFGFSVKGKRMATMSDTCLNVFGNLYVEGTFGVASSAACNTILTGYLRSPDIDGATLDISQTGIKTSGNLRVSGYIVDICTNGYLRMLQDDGTTTRFDVSDGNIRYLGKLIGSTDTTSNRVGGITLSNSRIGVGTSAPTVALEVVGDVSATTYNGPGGTAGAPHYTFSDDRTTGIFFPGANIVGLSAGGVERMRISNNRIGIGISNPTNALDVSGVLRVVGANGNITFSNGSIDVSGTPLVSTTGAFSNSNTTSNSIGGVTLSNTNISYAGTITGSTANTSNSIGGVTLSNTTLGINATVSSNERLRVAGVARIDASLIVNASSDALLARMTSNDSIYASNRIHTDAGHFVGISESQYLGAGASAPLIVSSTNVGMYVLRDSVSATSLFFRTRESSTDTERMRITSAGFVGIGTSTPLSQLDVTTGPITVNRLGNIANTTDVAAVVEGSSSVGMYWQKGSNNNNCGVSFRTLSNATLAERIRIDGNTGRVGIGTSAPVTTLDVNGAVSIAGTQLISSTGALTNISSGSNQIGGVTLSNTNIIYAGTITGSTANTSNSIGGVTLSNGYVGINTPADINYVLDGSNSVNTGIRVRSGGEASVETFGRTGMESLAMFHGGAAAGVAGFKTRDSSFATVFLTGSSLTERLRIVNSNGNVGIGVTAPAATLDVSGTGMRVAKANALFDVTFSGTNYANTTTNGYFTIYAAGTTNKAAGNVRVQMTPENGAPYYFLSNNFGIGTSNPQTTLDVAAGTITLNRLGNIANTTDVSAVVEGSSGVGMYWQKGSNNNNCGVSFRTLSNATVAERIRIDANTGRVGIGTSAPISTLDISQRSGDVVGLTVRNNSTSAFIRILGTGQSDGEGMLLENSSSQSSIRPSDFQPLLLGRFAELCISGTRVGIGTSNPSFQFQLSTDSAAKPTTNTWTISSDRRIKQNIQNADISLCYDVVKHLKLKRFTWDVSYMPNVPDRNSVGWIAQDVSDVFPRAVTQVKNDWFDDFHSLDVDQIYKTMYGALEKVIADKEALESRVATLESQLSIVLERLASQQSSGSTLWTLQTLPTPSESVPLELWTGHRPQ